FLDVAGLKKGRLYSTCAYGKIVAATKGLLKGDSSTSSSSQADSPLPPRRHGHGHIHHNHRNPRNGVVEPAAAANHGFVGAEIEAPKKKVSWKEGTVDNEFMNKKSSKKCCIFHKEKAL
ncbi:type 1 phosphatases regulator ypi2, partial [Phtheirospermum japonicum]